jgi:hypothetical protein
LKNYSGKNQGIKKGRRVRLRPFQEIGGFIDSPSPPARRVARTRGGARHGGGGSGGGSKNHDHWCSGPESLQLEGNVRHAGIMQSEVGGCQ